MADPREAEQFSNIIFLYYFGRRGGSRTVAVSKVKLFVIIVNGWKP